MLTHETASEILSAEVQAGKKLFVAAHASIPALKTLLETCLANDIPAALGPCGSGG